MSRHEALITVFTPRGRLTLRTRPDATLRELLQDAHLPLDSRCGGAGACGLCKLRIADGRSSPIKAAERHALSEEQIRQGWRLGCQASLLDQGIVFLDDEPIDSHWHAIPDNDLASDRELAVKSCGRTGLGVAVDIGTTCVRATLWDLAHGGRLASCSGRNPQAGFGADVLSRLEAAGDGHAQQLCDAIVSAIGEAIDHTLSSAAGSFGPADIGHIVIVGNTCMLMLLTETPPAALLDPAAWELPVRLAAGNRGEWRERWSLREDTAIHVLPPIGGFVGSDLTSCLMATAISESAPGTLLVDIGTNTEIAWWDGATLWITSTPGGPALEGVGIACGMPAEPGAVCRLAATGTPASYNAWVLGNRQPRGLCGSGLVDAVTLLLQDDALQPSGRLSPAAGSSITFLANPAEIDGEPSPMTLTGRDIDAFQRAKGAIGAAIEALLKFAGSDFEDIGHLHLCGLFGRHLDLGHARAIGLIPDLPDERIHLSGNAALTGCELALLNAGALEQTTWLERRSHLLNLTSVPEFEDIFIKHLRLRPVEGRGWTR
jgi:uncharacterized 2Fe-2S/4Fe-4S cluster protein (DUF4445 family)